MAENNDEKKSRENYGFNLYPERRSGKSESTWWDKLLGEPGDSEFSKFTCENNKFLSHNLLIRMVFDKCYNDLDPISDIRSIAGETEWLLISFSEIFSDPLIKILVGALKKAGCPINLNRHIVCEACEGKVQGGYDSEYNQIVVCKNYRKSRNSPDTVLMHELIHMYDYCVNDVDFTNIEHLACTEIRAANLAHCSFLSSLFVGQSTVFDIKSTHQYCVKMRAAYSLVVSRNLDFKTALNYVLKVFDKCYNDLEPIGRRLRRKSYDPVMAYDEGKHYKICD